MKWTIIEPFVPVSIIHGPPSALPASKDPVVQTRAEPFFENLIGYQRAAKYLGLSEAYLRRLKSQGKIPYVQVGRRGIRFRITSLDAWVLEREIK